MTQAVVLSFIDDIEYKDYTAGQVVDFPDSLVPFLKRRFLIDTTPSVVAAAIAGGKTPVAHVAGSAPGGAASSSSSVGTGEFVAVVGGFTQADIDTAVNAVLNSPATRGIVVFPDGIFTLTKPLTMYSGVSYRGVPPVGVQNTTDGSYATAGGSVLRGDGTFNGFEWNATDGAATPATQAAINGEQTQKCNIYGFKLENFLNGIKAGAKWRGGLMWSTVDEIYASGCAEWGVWFENFQHCTFGKIACFSNTKGQACFAGSGGSVFNYGNSRILDLFAMVSGSNSLLQRGIQFIARGGANSTLNDVKAEKVQCNRVTGAGSYSTQAATLTASSQDIVVVDGTKFPVGMPVSFSVSSNNFNAGQIYFVVYQSGNTIRLANAVDGAVLTANASGPVATNIGTQGFPNLFVGAIDGASQIQPISIYGLDVENNSTASVVVQNSMMCRIDAHIIQTGGANTGDGNAATFCVRNSAGAIYTNGQPATCDISTDCANLMFFGAQKRTFGNGSSKGMGRGVWASGEPPANNGVSQNSHVLCLGDYEPTWWIDAGIGSTSTGRSLKIGHKQIPTGQVLLGYQGNAGVWTYTTASAGSLSLPQVSNSGSTRNTGTLCHLSNPTGNAVTLSVTGGGNMVVGGQLVTSFVVPAYTNVHFVAHDGGAAGLVWALYGAVTVGGTALFSGTGAQTAFSIPHGLGVKPNKISVNAGSAAAAGAFWIAADATNIVVTYTAAPASGASNLSLSWTASL